MYLREEKEIIRKRNGKTRLKTETGGGGGVNKAEISLVSSNHLLHSPAGAEHGSN